MITVLTETSAYLFDEAGRYLRMPNGERGRVFFERLEQMLSNGPMDDHVWNELVDIKFIRHPLSQAHENDSLNIFAPGAVHGIVTTCVANESLEAARKIVGQYHAEGAQ